MILGIFLHAANIYSIDANWLVSDHQRSQVFNVISDLIHVFRMPTFFWISGYFCALTFERNGAEGLFRKRLPRLLVPLLMTWGTLNLAQELLLASMNGQSMTEALYDGVPLFHLWFLFDLVIFIGVAAIILPRFKPLNSLGRSLAKLPLALMLPLLALLSLSVSLAARSTGIAYDSFLNLTSIFRLAEYAPFFAIGIFMYRCPDARTTFTQIPVFFSLVTLPLAIFADKYTHDQNFVIEEIALFVEFLMVWSSVAIVLSFFYKLVKKDNLITRCLSEMAYSVYLFHHIFVVIIGMILIDYPLNAWIKFSIVCTISLSGAMFIHVMLIRNNRTVRLLFNGK